MFSSGLASRTMKSALLPAATMPVLNCPTSAESRVAMTIASAGVNPIVTQFSNFNCSVPAEATAGRPVVAPVDELHTCPDERLRRPSCFPGALTGAFDNLLRHPLEIVALLCHDLFARQHFPQQRVVPRLRTQGSQVPGLIEPDRSITLGDALPDDREQFLVGHFPAADRNVGGAHESRFVQLLGVRQTHGMRGDGDIVLARLIDNCSIERRCQCLELSLSSVHPDLDERDLVLDIVLNCASSLLFGGHRIHHVISGRMTASPRPRPRHPRPRRAKERCVGNDLFLHPQRHVAPGEATCLRHLGVPRSLKDIEMITRHDLALDEIGNADDGAEPEVRVTLQMVDEVLARVVLLRRRARHNVLVTQVTVHIHFRRHDGLARQIHARRAGWNLHLTPPTHAGEPTVLNDECGVLDRRAAVARNEPRPFEHRHAGRPPRLVRNLRRTGRGGEQTRRDRQTRQGSRRYDSQILLDRAVRRIAGSSVSPSTMERAHDRSRALTIAIEARCRPTVPCANTASGLPSILKYPCAIATALSSWQHAIISERC